MTLDDTIAACEAQAADFNLEAADDGELTATGTKSGRRVALRSHGYGDADEPTQTKMRGDLAAWWLRLAKMGVR